MEHRRPRIYKQPNLVIQVVFTISEGNSCVLTMWNISVFLNDLTVKGM